MQNRLVNMRTVHLIDGTTGSANDNDCLTVHMGDFIRYLIDND